MLFDPSKHIGSLVKVTHHVSLLLPDEKFASQDAIELVAKAGDIMMIVGMKPIMNRYHDSNVALILMLSTGEIRRTYSKVNEEDLLDGFELIFLTLISTKKKEEEEETKHE